MVLFLALALPASAEPPATIPILVYHRFGATPEGETVITAQTFEAQLAWLEQHDVRIIPLRDAVDQLANGTPATSRSAVITIDDGHVSVYATLFPIIRRHQLPVTLFIYPSAISNAAYALTWDELREMQASGLVDIQSHTYWHPNFKVERRRRSADGYVAFVDHQLRQSKRTIEQRLGRPVDMLAWPFGIVDPDLEAAAKKAGYRAAFAYAGGLARTGQSPMALARIPVTDGDRGDRFGALLRMSGAN